jgi:hypothetical protein
MKIRPMDFYILKVKSWYSKSITKTEVTLRCCLHYRETASMQWPLGSKSLWGWFWRGYCRNETVVAQHLWIIIFPPSIAHTRRQPFVCTVPTWTSPKPSKPMHTQNALSGYHCQSPLSPSLRALGYFFGLPSATTLTYLTPPTQR